MAERKKREKVPNMESLTMGNCTISLTLEDIETTMANTMHPSVLP